MEEIDIALIKKRSISGILALTSRTFILQIIGFVAGSIFLPALLSPAVFGIFAVVSAIVSFLNYFSDIGLAASLIQKHEALTNDDLRTTFTIQQVLVGIIVIISLSLSGLIAKFYGLDIDGLWLLRALIISFFLSSLKTIPAVLLERELNFKNLAIPQLLENFCYYVIAVILAWRGFGITSFTWAVLVRAIVGLIAIYLISPWKISVGFSSTVAKKLLKFGVPLQINSFLALLKDDLLTVFLGKILPFAEVGYIGWAKKWAEIPLRLIMDNVIRVTFPTFSRLQSSEFLGKAIERVLFGIALTIFPISVALMFFIKPFVTLIPLYQKWEPAIFSFYVFSVVSIVASLSSPLTNAFNAIGKVKITFWLMIGWTASTWILTIILVNLYGFNGFSLALLLVALSIIIVVYLAKKVVEFSFWTNIRLPSIAAMIQTIWLILFINGHQASWWRLAFGEAAGVILYVVILWFFEKKRIKQLIADLMILK